MEEINRNFFWSKTVKVKEAPFTGKIYNSFSRARKDDLPQSDLHVFSKGALNEKMDKIELD